MSVVNGENGCNNTQHFMINFKVIRTFSGDKNTPKTLTFLPSFSIAVSLERAKFS